jgi:predicted dienelactone hydrolase
MEAAARSKLWRWLRRAAAVLGLLVLVAVCFLTWFLHIPDLPAPPGVGFHTETVQLTGKGVKVDLFLPARVEGAPLVVISHGFSRNRRTMTGWGGMLAAKGFVVAALDLPALADHDRNGRALNELLLQLREGHLLGNIKPSSRTALVGFSAGGLWTLLAASRDTNVVCWVGLDPVGLGRMGTRPERELQIPSFVLRAEPAPWNANGNAKEIFESLPGPALSLIVKDATHVDPENPTSRAADWACGKSDPIRRQRFGRCLLAALQAGLMNDRAALESLLSLTNDAAFHDVTSKRRELFSGGK